MTTGRRPAAEASLELATSWGVIRLAARGGRICACILPHLAREPRRAFRLAGSRCVAAAAADRRALRQAEYFLRGLFAGRVRLAPELVLPPASAFITRVWEALQEIPRGATLSYGAIARSVGCPHKARVVGLACRANALPLFVPCHRVLAADGSPGGFSAGLPWKRLLLEMEQHGHG